MQCAWNEPSEVAEAMISGCLQDMARLPVAKICPGILRLRGLGGWLLLAVAFKLAKLFFLPNTKKTRRVCIVRVPRFLDGTVSDCVV